MRWINPEKDETLSSYANRLINIYRIGLDEPIVLIGHSFGGLVTQEIAIRNPQAQIILLSSVKSPEEIPWKIRFLKYGYAYHLAGKGFIKTTFNIWGGYHGYNNEELRHLLLDEVDSLESHYFPWGYKQVIHWEGLSYRNRVDHIHGDDDRTFPLENIKNPIVIKGGDHLMVYKMAKEVSATLQSVLQPAKLSLDG